MLLTQIGVLGRGVEEKAHPSFLSHIAEVKAAESALGASQKQPARGVEMSLGTYARWGKDTKKIGYKTLSSALVTERLYRVNPPLQ